MPTTTTCSGTRVSVRHPLGIPRHLATGGRATAPNWSRHSDPTWPDELAGLVGQVAAADGTYLPWSGTAIEMITHDAHAKGHTGCGFRQRQP